MQELQRLVQRVEKMVFVADSSVKRKSLVTVSSSLRTWLLTSYCTHQTGASYRDRLQQVLQEPFHGLLT
jgi:glycosyltransferase A (GT-A) superfamily protein (DUF2064 family)